jgi:predicted metal-dependent enzyme (double-stranded beta helix superfamily)
MAGDTAEIRNHANLIWGVAELLRGDSGRSIFPSAATTHRTPAASSARASPNLVAPAS